MRQFKATQNTPQTGVQSLYMRFVGKLFFMKGAQGSLDYVNKLIADFTKRGALIQRGNGGWIMVDIIRDHVTVKIADIIIDQEEMSPEEIEGHMCEFYMKKYAEAKFLVQEIEG